MSHSTQQQRVCGDSWEMHVWDLLCQAYQTCQQPRLKIQRKKTISSSVAHTSVIVTYHKSVLQEESSNATDGTEYKGEKTKQFKEA